MHAWEGLEGGGIQRGKVEATLKRVQSLAVLRRDLLSLLSLLRGRAEEKQTQTAALERRSERKPSAPVVPEHA